MDIIGILTLGIPLAIAPGIAFAFFIYLYDRYDREPFKLLRNCFLFGALSIVPAILIESGFGFLGIDEGGGLLITFVYAFFVVGLTEEGGKFIFLRFYAYPKKDFNEPMDGIVYSLMISMGFATVENVLYAFSGLGTTMLRMFTAVPLHATAAVFMGYFAGLARFRKGSGWLLFVGFTLAVLLHGFYDFFLFQQDYPLLFIFSFLALGISVLFALLAIRRHRRHSPFKNAAPDSNCGEQAPQL
jgi:protease PrsW